MKFQFKFITPDGHISATPIYKFSELNAALSHWHENNPGCALYGGYDLGAPKLSSGDSPCIEYKTLQNALAGIMATVELYTVITYEPETNSVNQTEILAYGIDQAKRAVAAMPSMDDQVIFGAVVGTVDKQKALNLESAGIHAIDLRTIVDD